MATKKPSATVIAFPAQSTEVAAAFAGKPGITSRRMMSSVCLMIDTRLFVMDGRKGFIVKLPAARVAELIAGGAGHPFAPRAKPMKEWVVITDPDLDRVKLAREACAYVRSLQKG